MGNAVVIKAEMSHNEAAAMLADLKEGYRLVLNDQWYADDFRYVPEAQRHDVILSKNPKMAARKRLIGALSHSLNAVK